MKLSIVTTMYFSAPYIKEFYDRITAALQRITDDYEIIFVNDGSPDNSLDLAVQMHHKDGRVVVIDLSRNFGHHKAMMTGLSHSRGEFVFLIDVDLEEEPELLNTFWNEMRSVPDFDVLYGIQETRKGSWIEKITGRIFYWSFNKLASVEVPENPITARLMTRRYVNALVSFKEQEVFMAGLWAAAGFAQKPIMVKKHSHSPTTYSVRKKLSILVNSITSFSNKPLIFVFYSGTTITLFSFCYIVYLVIQKYTTGVSVSGWPSLIASIWFIGGVTIFSIGIVGIYLSKIFSETKQRPYTIIRHIYKKHEATLREYK